MTAPSERQPRPCCPSHPQAAREAGSARRSRRDRRRAMSVEWMESRLLLTAPTVVTGPASQVTLSGATLNATVNPNGTATAPAFQYSTSPQFAPSVQTTVGSGFSLPLGVAVDAAGDVFVADRNNGTVEEVLTNGTIKTIASGINAVSGVAVDGAGDVFYSDFSAVREVLPGGTIKTIGPGFFEPTGMAVDAAGDVFVCDTGDGAVTEVLANGTTKAIGSGFNGPQGVAVDAAGDVFVADSSNNAVKEVTPDGSVLTIGSGFNNPNGIALDAAGDVFVADSENNAVKEVLPNGTILTLGSGFNQPDDVAVDGAGDVFVADSGNSRVVKLAPPPTVAATPSPLSGTTAQAASANLTGLTANTLYYYRAVATGAGGTVDGSASSFLTTPAPTVVTGPATAVTSTSATLNSTVNPNGTATAPAFQYSTSPLFTPTVQTVVGSGFGLLLGEAMDAAGDVFVTDRHNGTVEEVLPNGTIKTIGSGFKAPGGVAVDSAGDVFVADYGNSAVKEVLPGGTILTIGPKFLEPFGVAVDTSGDVFVADTGNNAVKEILANGTIKTIGSGFNGPQGVAVDAAGDVFVADTDNAAVKEVLPNGTILTLGSGFNNPNGIALDGSGDVFVADLGNNAVKEVLPDGTITTIGSGFSAPVGVAVDAAGDVFVADTGNNRVVELSPPTVAATPSPLSGSTAQAASAGLTGLTANTLYYYRAVATGAGGTVAGSASSFLTTTTTVVTGPATSITTSGATLGATVNPNGTATAPAFQYSTSPLFTPTVQTNVGSGFLSSYGVAVDAAGDVFVADSDNSAVKEVLPNGTITTIGSGFAAPRGVAVDGAGDVFVADSNNNAVKEVLPNGTIKTIGSGFNQPRSVAVDAAGDVFVADTGNSAVKEVLPNGTIKTIGSGFSGPFSVAVDAAGDVFVADNGNGAIKEVLPNGTISTIGSGFLVPFGVAVDAAGDVFVADSEHNAVKEVLPNGTITTIGPVFLNPRGVAVDGAGDVFVIDGSTNVVVKLAPPTVAGSPSSLSGTTAQAASANLTGLTANTLYYYRAIATGVGGAVAGPASSFVTTVPPTVVTGAATSITTSGATLNGTVNPNGTATAPAFQYSTSPQFTPTVQTVVGSGFNHPNGVAVDAAGDVFVADTLNNAVKEVLPDGTIKTIGSGFNSPYGVAVDGSGDVFVADTGNNAVKEVLPNGTINTIGSGFSSPFDVAVDAAGDVFVSDTGHNAVKEVLPNGTILTIGSGFSSPRGVAVDAAGDVFVADTGNNAVKEVLPNGTINTIGSGFNSPYGVSVDAAGDVFVADTINLAVKEVLPGGTILTLGSGFNNPTAVVSDGAGDLFIADSGNSRVVKLAPPTLAATPSSLSGTTAQAASANLTGLALGTTYYYRAIASGAGGISVGATAQFTTTTTLQVTGLTPTTTGFTATFNEPFNLALINLYSTATGGQGPADVTLVGASTGPVTGSLIVTPGNQAITFVKTGGILAPDTYTITFRSAANGFTDTSGGLLDGNGDGTPGDNYTTTFTVAPSTARVLALPDFARGPGQPVVVPAMGGTGLPLTISDGTGVTSISLSITYNTSLLSITGVNLGTNAPAGSMVFLNTPIPGLAFVTFTSPTALPAGLDNFATLVASVPNAAPYASKQDLVIGGMSINGGAIPAIDQDGVHAVAYLGDTSGNGGYSSLDASLILRVVASSDSGFAAYPLLDPTIAADIAGRGSLSSIDASFLLQFVANLPQPRIPALPGVTITTGGPDPLIWVPQDLDATPGSTLTVPVMFQQTNGTTIGLDSANLALEFDPNLFLVTGVSLGGVTQGFTLNDSYNNATGTLIVSEQSSNGPIQLSPGTLGTLLLVDVTVRPGADLGSSRINLLAVGRVGSSVLYTSLNDGYLTLTPAPSNSDLTSTDGVVAITATATTSPTSPTPAMNGTSQAVPAITAPLPLAGLATVIVPARMAPTSASPLPPYPAPGSSPVAAGPAQVVDRAIEASHGPSLVATRPAVLGGPPSSAAIPAELIPWTPSDDSLTTTDSTTNPTPKKARDSRVLLTQAIPDVVRSCAALNTSPARCEKTSAASEPSGGTKSAPCRPRAAATRARRGVSGPGHGLPGRRDSRRLGAVERIATLDCPRG